MKSDVHHRPMSCDRLIENFEKLIQIYDHEIRDLKMPNEPRYRIAGGCFYTAMQHQKAIMLLVAKQLYGPAVTLVRPIYEAFLRGIWIFKCADERQLEDFIKGNVPKLSRLLEDIERLEGHNEKVLSAIKNKYGSNMNAYVHTGIQQVIRLQTQETIEQNYHEDEITDILQLSGLFGCLSAIYVCEMCLNQDKMNYIFKKFVEELY